MSVWQARFLRMTSTCGCLITSDQKMQIHSNTQCIYKLYRVSCELQFLQRFNNFRTESSALKCSKLCSLSPSFLCFSNQGVCFFVFGTDKNSCNLKYKRSEVKCPTKQMLPERDCILKYWKHF